MRRVRLGGRVFASISGGPREHMRDSGLFLLILWQTRKHGKPCHGIHGREGLRTFFVCGFRDWEGKLAQMRSDFWARYLLQLRLGAALPRTRLSRASLISP